MTNKELIRTLNKINRLVMRINLKTDHAAWFSIVGHVNAVQVSVSKSKEDYHSKIMDKYLYYDDVTLDNVENEYHAIITSLTTILNVGKAKK